MPESELIFVIDLYIFFFFFFCYVKIRETAASSYSLCGSILFSLVATHLNDFILFCVNQLIIVSLFSRS